VKVSESQNSFWLKLIKGKKSLSRVQTISNQEGPIKASDLVSVTFINDSRIRAVLEMEVLVDLTRGRRAFKVLDKLRHQR